MKTIKLLLALLLTLSLTSCGVPQHEYDYLRDEYNSALDSVEDRDRQIEDLEDDIRWRDEELDYYHQMCADLGLLTYDELDPLWYCYVCNGLFHYNYFCSRVDPKQPDFLRLCSLGYEQKNAHCPECAGDNITDTIYFYDPQSNIAHDMSSCNTITPGTKDYVTLIQPLELVYLSSALERGCALCPVCTSAEK